MIRRLERDIMLGPSDPSNSHELVPDNVLQALVEALHARMRAGPAQQLEAKDIDAVADELGLKRAHAWVAAGLDPSLAPESDEDVLIGICVGQCQMRGAVANLEKLLECRDARAASGKRGFGIVPRRCFDRCMQGPVAVCQTPDGMAGLPKMTAEQVSGVVEQIFEDLDPA